jgi:hypothetical protein
MTVTAHALVGASLGVIIKNPYLALSTAFFSNFVMDMIPHWDTGTGWHSRPKTKTFIISGIDTLCGFGLGWLLFSGKIDPVYLGLMMFSATLADWLEAPYIFLNLKIPPFYWFYKIQSKLHSRNGLPLGIVTQLIIVLPLLYLAFFKS